MTLACQRGLTLSPAQVSKRILADSQCEGKGKHRIFQKTEKDETKVIWGSLPQVVHASMEPLVSFSSSSSHKIQPVATWPFPLLSDLCPQLLCCCECENFPHNFPMKTTSLGNGMPANVVLWDWSEWSSSSGRNSMHRPELCSAVYTITCFTLPASHSEHSKIIREEPNSFSLCRSGSFKAIIPPTKFHFKAVRRSSFDAGNLITGHAW